MWGAIVEVAAFLEAQKPAYKIKADFGPEPGILQSSAQVTALYSPAELLGCQIIGVVNFLSNRAGLSVPSFCSPVSIEMKPPWYWPSPNGKFPTEQGSAKVVDSCQNRSKNRFRLLFCLCCCKLVVP